MSVRRFFTLFVMFSILAFLFIACDDSSSDPKDDNPPTFQTGDFKTIDIPTNMQTAANSGNVGAVTAISFINTANAFANYGSFFTIPEGATRQKPAGTLGEWVYSWTSENLTITLTITETDEYVMYQYSFDGSDQYYTYDNLVWLEYMAYKNTNEGWLKIYDLYGQTSNLVWLYEWETAANGTYTFNMYLYDYQGVVDYEIEVVANTDGSGSIFIDYITAGWWNILWDTSGNGSWNQYDESGTILGSGTW